MEDFNLKDLDVIEDSKTKEVLLKILKSTDKRIEEKVKERLEDSGLSEEYLSLAPKDRALMADQKKVDAIADIWRNNGKIPGTNKKITYEELAKKDMAYTKKIRMSDNFSTDHPLLIPRVISSIVRDAIYPNFVVTPLLQRVNYTAGSQVVFPAWGGVGSAAYIPEGGEYPERSMELAGQVTATIGKYGLAVKCTDEMVRYSQFDVMAAHFRHAVKELAMLKERQAVDLMLNNGRVIMDNTGTGYRSTTGRGWAGDYNGTITLDDIFYLYGDMVNNGFVPDTLFMHPFAWKIFANEGISRALGFVNGNISSIWAGPQGSPGNAPQWRVGSNGLLNGTTVDSPSQLATTFTNVPAAFPHPFRIVVTPYMTFDSTTQRTTLAFAQLSELGLLIVDEDVVTEEWDDPARDIMKVKFRERYAMATLNNGYGIGLVKDVSLARSFDFTDKIGLQLSTLGSNLSGDQTGNYSDV
jgi:HK97 family phage major capsid protein